MKLAATIIHSLEADMQAELRDIERAVAGGIRDAGRGLRTELRRQVGSAGLRQRLANSWRDKHYPNQRLDAASLVYTKAPPIIRAFDEGAVNPEPARALSRHPDRERATEGNRRQADQPEHLPPAQLRAAPVGAWIQRTVAPCGGRLARLVQQANRRAPRLSASDRSGPAQRPRPDHGRDVSAAAAGETAQAPRRRSCGGALVEAAAGADRAAVRSE
jgi:hypothetical protein